MSVSPAKEKENCKPCSACPPKLSPDGGKKRMSGEGFDILIASPKNPAKQVQLYSPSFDKAPVEERCKLACERKQQMTHVQVTKCSEHHEHIKRAQRQICDQFQEQQKEVLEQLTKKEETSEQRLQRIKQEKDERAEENNRRLLLVAAKAKLEEEKQKIETAEKLKLKLQIAEELHNAHLEEIKIRCGKEVEKAKDISQRQKENLDQQDEKAGRNEQVQG